MIYTDKIYGEFELTGVIQELINTRVFQRLKKVHQGGVLFLFDPKINHTRFEHSIGVFLLIRKMGGSLEEQIAGLLHDISHTAFSHLIDYVLGLEEEDYHEKRFEAVLRDKELVAILKKYGFDIDQFMEVEQYHILEYPLPDLCADRIDYTLRDLFQIGVVSKSEIDWFLDSLVLFENRIVLNSQKYANWFKEKYQFLNDEYFNKKENVEANIIMTQIVKDALDKGLIEEKDFYFDDFYLINKIKEKINLSEQIKTQQAKGIDLSRFKTKKRVVEPEIIQRLL